jgi:beta-glucosidase
VSVVLNIFRVEAETPEDADAAQRFDAVANRVFTGPMLRGAYPDDLLADTGHVTDWSFVLPGDTEICHQPLDLLGINYYEIMHVRTARDVVDHPAGGTAFPGSEFVELFRPAHAAKTAMGWTVEARGLEDHLIALSRDFPGLPLMVMENGAAFIDSVSVVDGDAVVEDHERVAYLADHLRATWRARERGANVAGYFVWSLLDNFEWAEGYGPRFGVIRVDYDSLERIPKLSGRWLTQLCKSRTLPHSTHV